MEISVRVVISNLKFILPDSIFLNTNFNKYQTYLLSVTTAILNSTEMKQKECAIYASDLQMFNLGQNEEFDKSKFETYFKAMETVVNLASAGTHNRKHAQVSLYITLILSLVLHLTYQYSLQLRVMTLRKLPMLSTLLNQTILNKFSKKQRITWSRS